MGLNRLATVASPRSRVRNGGQAGSADRLGVYRARATAGNLGGEFTKVPHRGASSLALVAGAFRLDYSAQTRRLTVGSATTSLTRPASSNATWNSEKLEIQ